MFADHLSCCILPAHRPKSEASISGTQAQVFAWCGEKAKCCSPSAIFGTYYSPGGMPSDRGFRITAELISEGMNFPRLRVSVALKRG